jgi:hypothetical protein
MRASRCGCQLADLLLPWLHTQRDAVEVMSLAGDTERVAAFERHGLRHRRSSLSLARSDRAGPVPAAAFPDGVDVTPYRLGDADEVVHRLIRVDAAWGIGPRTRRARPRCLARDGALLPVTVSRPP